MGPRLFKLSPAGWAGVGQEVKGERRDSVGAGVGGERKRLCLDSQNEPVTEPGLGEDMRCHGG